MKRTRLGGYEEEKENKYKERKKERNVQAIKMEEIMELNKWKMKKTLNKEIKTTEMRNNAMKKNKRTLKKERETVKN